MTEDQQVKAAKREYEIALYKSATKAAILIGESISNGYNNQAAAKVELALNLLAIVEGSTSPSDNPE